jgi:hypothetical protein
MKSSNARTSLHMSLLVSSFVALALLGQAYGGEYYTYEDLSGNLVISNNAPPPGSKIIKKQTLSEVTDQQIAASQVREDTVRFDNRISSLQKTNDALAENLRLQSEIINNLQQGHGDTNIAVGVTQGPAVVRRISHSRFNRPINLNNNPSNRRPRAG